MKKLLNDPTHVVAEMVEGLVWSRPSLMKLQDHFVVVRRDVAEDAALRDQKVALVSGGGSGHEPAHAGFVGQGLLSAAVAGDVFTSPAPDAILAAIRAVTGARGCLLIIKNYTGDRLNFGLAAEMARAEGYQVQMVIVADDVALASDDSTAGRRGIAGTVLVHKIAGAAAEEGKSLEEVYSIAKHVADNVRTMGVALSPCIVPAVGKPTFTLAPNEVELGLGIHGEAGVRKQPLQSADKTADQLIEAILADAKLSPNSHIVVVVNNLGATTSMELYIIARRVLQTLEQHDFIVDRLIVGTFMTALEMAGVSVTVLPANAELLSLLDAPAAHDAAWHGFSRTAPDRKRAVVSAKPSLPVSTDSAPTSAVPKTLVVSSSVLTDLLKQVINSVLEHEDLLTRLDQETGDGDFGITLARGGHAVLKDLQAVTSSGSFADSLQTLGMILQRSMGGTSGALYGMFFLRLVDSLRSQASSGIDSSTSMWAEAVQAGTKAIAQLGGAKLGDCTMLDALLPATDRLMNAASKQEKDPDWRAILAAAEAARKGADSTSDLVRRKGRGSFLGERARGHKDAGAEAVALIFAALLAALRE